MLYTYMHPYTHMHVSFSSTLFYVWIRLYSSWRMKGMQLFGKPSYCSRNWLVTLCFSLVIWLLFVFFFCWIENVEPVFLLPFWHLNVCSREIQAWDFITSQVLGISDIAHLNISLVGMLILLVNCCFLCKKLISS